MRAAVLIASVAAACAAAEAPPSATTPCPPGEKCDGAGGPASSWAADWTLLVYAANDDLSAKLIRAFDEDAEEWRTGLGGSALFRILVQRDYAASQRGPDGAPRASERYGLYREQRFDPETYQLEDPAHGQTGTMVLGETDTTDPGALRDFLVDGIRRFPARHYWLIVTGHGDGWAGLAFDATAGGAKRMPIAGLAEALREASSVIADEIRTRPGLDAPTLSKKLDVAQFDVCRLGTIETAAVLEDSVDFLVASQENMPDAGHPYSALRFIAQDHPGYGADRIVEEVVSDYIRSYVEGVSTVDRAYVGTTVTSVGLNLTKLAPLRDAIATLRDAVLAERAQGFSCREVADLAFAATHDENVQDKPTDGQLEVAGGRSTAAGAASIDLFALLSTLASPSRATGPAVSENVRLAAHGALDVIGRPTIWTPEHPKGSQLQFGGQYRKLVDFNPKGPFVVEAHRVEPETSKRAAGLSVLWGNPYDLLIAEDGSGEAPLDVYRALAFEAQTGWTAVMGQCVAQATACRDWAPDPSQPDAPNPCDELP